MVNNRNINSLSYRVTIVIYLRVYWSVLKLRPYCIRNQKTQDSLLFQISLWCILASPFANIWFNQCFNLFLTVCCWSSGSHRMLNTEMAKRIILQPEDASDWIFSLLYILSIVNANMSIKDSVYAHTLYLAYWFPRMKQEIIAIR